ncbi:unnamed protein product [Adineta steineri]|uniref:CKK domain-containing protein n=1 Tax=Adineta steineri TaxID=433720 RepID=A0A814VIE3_9BILA|nr:unnamed protein product [Adineta steineri]CAF3722421.1 unnamed protein product [Adineta steineri]
MTTVINTTNAEVTTPTSYVSRWIAQSHNTYQNKTNELYSPLSSSLCDFRTPSAACRTLPTIFSPIKSSTVKPQTTTWQAQARSRLDASNTALNHMSSFTSSDNNIDLQEKLHHVRALLDAKKQRLCRHLSSSSSVSSSSTIPEQAISSAVVGDQSWPPPPPAATLSVENVCHPHDEPQLPTVYPYHQSLTLPCLMEESPSDSGLSDGTKTTNNEDIADATTKNSAMIDLSKPLSREEMLAIIQVLRELWKKQFGSEILDMHIKSSVSTSNVTEKRRTVNTERISYLSNNNRNQYHSTPTLNKLSAELSDIKDKLKKFSNGRTTIELSKDIPVEKNSNVIEPEEIQFIGDTLVFIPVGDPLTPQEIERMQARKEALIRRQIQRREQQMLKKNQRLTDAIERQNEYRLYEEYTAQRRQENDLRRTTILQAHKEQKRLEADPPSSHDYYFTAARTRNRLKRKASMTSFMSFDDVSYGESTFDLMSNTSGRKSNHTAKTHITRFDLLSPSVLASTSASRSKMNRAASTCNINEHYDSFTSLHSKATGPLRKTTKPTTLFGGSLMNIPMMNNKKCSQQQQSFNLLDEPFDLVGDSPLTGSLSSIALSIQTGSHLARSQTHLSTKTNKQAILNSLKQVVLAGPANERQREVVSREIELCEARHFIVLFRDHRLQFRAIYMYIPETDIIEKLYGVGPNIITEVMVDKWYKYNSGGKRFTNIPIRHFSIQCDAIIIHNDFWQKKLLMHINRFH